MRGCRVALRAIAFLAVVTVAVAQNFSTESTASVAILLPTSNLSGVTNSTLLTNRQSFLANRRSSLSVSTSSTELPKSQSAQSIDSQSSVTNEPITSSTVKSVSVTNQSIKINQDSGLTKPLSTKTPSLGRNHPTPPSKSDSPELEQKATQMPSDSKLMPTALSSSTSIVSDPPVVSVFRPVLSPTPRTPAPKSESSRTTSTESPFPSPKRPTSSTTNSTTISTTVTNTEHTPHPPSTVSSQDTFQNNKPPYLENLAPQTETTNKQTPGPNIAWGSSEYTVTSGSTDTFATKASNGAIPLEDSLGVSKTPATVEFTQSASRPEKSMVPSSSSKLPSTTISIKETPASEDSPGWLRSGDGVPSTSQTTTTKASLLASQNISRPVLIGTVTESARISPGEEHNLQQITESLKTSENTATTLSSTKSPANDEVNGVAATARSLLPIIVTEPTIPSTTSDRKVIKPSRPVVIVRVTRFVSVGEDSDGKDDETVESQTAETVSTDDVQDYVPESVLRSGAGDGSPQGKDTKSSTTPRGTEISPDSSGRNIRTDSMGGSEGSTTSSFLVTGKLGSTLSTIQELDDIKDTSTIDNLPNLTSHSVEPSTSTARSSTYLTTQTNKITSTTTETIVIPPVKSPSNKTSYSTTKFPDVSSHGAMDTNLVNSSSSRMTPPSATTTESVSPTASAATTEALSPEVTMGKESSTVFQSVTNDTPQKTEAISISPTSTATASKNIPTQSAAPSITPSYSSSFTVAPQSREVTYQTSESPLPQTTVKMGDTIPLSSVATPALVFTSPDQDATSQKPSVSVTEADKTDTVSSDFDVDKILSSSSVYTKTPVMSSSSPYLPPHTTSSVFESSSVIPSSVSIMPSSTVDITATITPDITTEATSTPHEVFPELTTTEESLMTSSAPTEGKKETTTEKSTVVTSAETTESSDVTSAELTSKPTSAPPEVTTESESAKDEEKETTTSETITTTRGASITTQSMGTGPTVVPLTYEPPLNTSDVYDEFWIVTVLKIPVDVKINNRDFVNDMEIKLANLFGNSLAGRLKRAATFNNVTSVQMIMVNRSAEDPQHTALTYYVIHRGVPIPAYEAVSIINGISSQRLAILLGYEVVSMGEVYKKGPDRKLWIIGAVIGALVVLVSLIWCVLFIYFKCTRPADKRSPRTARSNRTIDPESSFRAKKDFRVSQRDLRGFDIVRTEVGLESEIMREKGRSSDSYRRTAGSSELEGMYSPGDTPPPDAPLVQPTQEVMASRPNSKVHSLSRPLPSLPGSIGRKGKGKKTREESSEGETTGSEKPLTPANKNQGRKKGRAWSKGHSEDSDEDSDDEDGGPIRTGLHGVRLPPLPNPPYPSESYRDSLRQQQELEDSLKNKAESERQRNKQRQRDKKKDKKSKKDLKKEAEAKKAYKMVQKEMGQMLEDHQSSHQPNVFVDDQKNKGKRKRQQITNPRDSIELSELHAVQQQVEQDLRGLSSLQRDSDEESRQKAFEEARQRMHALLDDAFALIAPNPSDEEQDPELNSQQQNNGSTSKEEKKHTPMSITSSAKDKNNGERVVWSPYSAADTLAKIPSEELPDNYIQKYGDKDDPDDIRGASSKAKSKKKHHGYKEEINPAYEDSLKGRKQERYQKDYDDDSGYRTPGGRNRSSRGDEYSSAILDSKLFIPTGKIRSHSPPERDSNDIISNSQVMPPEKWKLDLPSHPNEVVSNNQSNKSSQRNPSSPPSMDIYTLQKDVAEHDKDSIERKKKLKPCLEQGEDEMDVIQKTVRHGVKEQPIVNSIREELKRLANRNSQDNEVD